jgi:hypothetical protein
VIAGQRMRERHGRKQEHREGTYSTPTIESHDASCTPPRMKPALVDEVDLVDVVDITS